MRTAQTLALTPALRVEHHPPYWMAGVMATALYANFFTHHYIGDYRWCLAAAALGLYARATVVFRPHQQDRRMRLTPALALMSFTIVTNLKHVKATVHVPE